MLKLPVNSFLWGDFLADLQTASTMEVVSSCLLLCCLIPPINHRPFLFFVLFFYLWLNITRRDEWR